MTEEMSRVEQVVKEILRDLLRVPMDRITRETSMSQLGADSLDIVEFVITLEDRFEGAEFNKERSVDVVRSGTTVGEAIELIEEHLKQWQHDQRRADQNS